MKRKFYALESSVLKQLLTFRGHVIFHDNPQDLKFLFEKPLEQGKLRIVELPNALGLPMMPLKQHPDMADVDWPIRRGDFWR